MLISPVIFCTIVLGVGSVANAAQVGKVGGLALAYFLTCPRSRWRSGWSSATCSTPAGAAISSEGAAAANEAASGEKQSTVDFLLRIIPTTLLSPLTGESVLQTLFVALLVGFALQSLGEKGLPVLRGIAHVQKLVFKILAMIMWLAPIGAFGAIAAVVGRPVWTRCGRWPSS